jgi:hypothetical protein
LQGPSGAAAPISALAHTVLSGPGVDAAGTPAVALATAVCPNPGQWAAGGGYYVAGVNQSVFPQFSVPTSDGKGWRVQLTSASLVPYLVTPYVVCVG